MSNKTFKDICISFALYCNRVAGKISIFIFIWWEGKEPSVISDETYEAGTRFEECAEETNL